MKRMRVLSILLLGLPIVWVAKYLLTNPETIAPFFNGSLMVIIPLYLGVIIAKKWGGSWRIFAIGSATFIGSQLLHVPFNNYILGPILNNFDITNESIGFQLIALAILLGLSAGLFEEFARYLVFKKWLPEVRGWKQGLMFGVGHGGIESMLLGAIVIYVFLQAIVLKNLNHETLAFLVGEANVESTAAYLQNYWQTPWYLSFLGAAERIFAITFHIAASLMVLNSIIKNNKTWLWISIAWHTSINAISVYASVSWGVLATESILLVMSIGSVLIIKHMLSVLPPEKKHEEEPPLPGPVSADDLARIN